MSALLKDNLTQTSIYAPTPARIVEIDELTAHEKLFKIELPDGLSLDNKPGQFVEVSLLGIGEAPISITSSPSRSNGTFELCVRRVGDLTNAMHNLNIGDHIGVRGPFGRGFPIDSFRGKDLLFLAGGLGLAPMRSLINEVMDDRGKYGRLTTLYGARTPADLLFVDELNQWDESDAMSVHITVDRPEENWEGNTGVITTLFPQTHVYARNTVAIVIGPPVMYRFVLMELLGKGIVDGNIWFSFERRMKCGVGKCGHCQMHHHYTCQSGPSFSYAEIKYLEEAL
jgi:sulfhydrogenase subunit gamma (sulfur reductase)